MQASPAHDFVVLGGGLAGLTFALEATRRARTVALLEAGHEVGGLARTLTFDDYRFDLGGHRFHSRWPSITSWVLDLMDGQMLEVARRSHIHLDGRLVAYPLQFPNALLALGPSQALRVLASYLKAAASRRRSDSHLSFESWVASRFGRALYDIYFRPYTEKVWGMSCTELSADWASERIQLPSLAAALKGSFLRRRGGPATLASRFLYPSLGIGAIPHRLAHKALASGRAAIHLRSHAVGLERAGPDGPWQVRYHQDGQERKVLGRRLISTIPLPALWRLLPQDDGDRPALSSHLAYRGLVCVFLAVDAPRISDDTWTYYPEGQIGFGRIHEPRNWSPAMVPPGRTSLCAEIFCSQGDETWQRSDGELVDSVCRDLARLGLVKRGSIRDAWLERVPEAYPCYRVGYAAALQQARAYLARRWPTVHLLGRTGAYQYMNMDAVIHQALSLAQELCHAG
ncbi:MAG: FAD-dependent oxidoreductase [Anaerolineae bacterium]|nr:FAD-dependent oxidoreductase [Anaerolineae bacterium]